MKRNAADKDQWAAYTVERFAVAGLTANPRNARRHSAEQVAALRVSLREFGWTMPLLIREGGVLIAGHGRLEAAKLEGYQEVPVIVARGWSEKQCRAYAIADNKHALNSFWDEDQLRSEFAELKDFSLEALGFETAELDDLLTNEGETFNLPEPPDEVKQNAATVDEIKRQRRGANKATESKNDTEHYIVIVYGSRAEREGALKRLGLPEDERYVLARAVEIKPRFGKDHAKVSGARSLKVADSKHSGAGG